ncbi:MAG TPA: GatB/YqeY domain-containing protein [Anaeromyxobacteraceae bacterium]|nr:GatB/YqeY domain-containing protein [Anaeromyxobacteraceae bacterium]
MGLRERLDADLKAAMKAKDELKLSVVRMLKSAVKYREVEGEKAVTLDEAGILQVVATEVKRRRDSVEQYRAGRREDLARKEEAEIVILQGYLPAQLSEAELRAKVDEVVARVGAKGPKDMGAVMRALLHEVQGRAEGKAVSDLVKQRLAGK